MKIYIAEKITGDKCYKQKFAHAERFLNRCGFSVMNPAWLVELPEFGWNDYMAVSYSFSYLAAGRITAFAAIHYYSTFALIILL